MCYLEQFWEFIDGGSYSLMVKINKQKFFDLRAWNSFISNTEARIEEEGDEYMVIALINKYQSKESWYFYQS